MSAIFVVRCLHLMFGLFSYAVDMSAIFVVVRLTGETCGVIWLL